MNILVVDDDPIIRNLLDAYLRETLACRVYPDIRTPLTVCYTPLNGAGLEPVRRIFAVMEGLTVVEVEAQTAPDGTRGSRGRPPKSRVQIAA